MDNTDSAVNLDGFSISEAPMDTDGDGLGDGAEWMAGTDPLRAESVFQCLEISALDFPMLGRILRWSSATGRVYSVYCLTNLLTSDLCPLTSGLPATPPGNVWTDTVSGAEMLLCTTGSGRR